MSTFKALSASEEEGGVKVAIAELSDTDLSEGDVTVDVLYSTVNYKDGLAVQGNRGRVMRRLPMVPGIDFSGVVARSESSSFAEGDEVILTGWGVGETHSGGFSQRARVKGDWLVKRPQQLSLQRSMALGTAGLTAMLSAMTLEEDGLTPDRGDVIVTGAAGGVGSVSVALLSQLGYNVIASTGRVETHDYLSGLGAGAILPREELDQPPRPMAPERWAGAVDTVGGRVLPSVIAATKYGGSIAVCGNAGGVEVGTTVLPFILRGISLRGIESVNCPLERRQRAWERLASTLPMDKLDAMTTVRPLSDVKQVTEDILQGKVRGRTVIDVNA